MISTLFILAESRPWLARFLEHLLTRNAAQVMHWPLSQWLLHGKSIQVLASGRAAADRWRNCTSTLDFVDDKWVCWCEPGELWQVLKRHSLPEDREYLYQAFLALILLRSRFSPSIQAWRPEHFSPGFQPHRIMIEHAQHLRLIANHQLMQLPFAAARPETWLQIADNTHAQREGEWRAVSIPPPWQRWLQHCQLVTGWRWFMIEWQPHDTGHNLAKLTATLDWEEHKSLDRSGFKLLAQDLHTLTGHTTLTHMEDCHETCQQPDHPNLPGSLPETPNTVSDG